MARAEKGRERRRREEEKKAKEFGLNEVPCFHFPRSLALVDRFRRVLASPSPLVFPALLFP